MKKKKILAKLQQHKFAVLRSRADYLLRNTSLPNTNSFLNKTLPSSTRARYRPHLLTHAQSVRNSISTKWSNPENWRLQLNRFWLCLLIFSCMLISTGCVALTEQFNGKVNYSNPPTVNTWLQPQRELVACETVLAARYMGDFGFLHPQCKLLTDIGERAYQVKSREIVQLKEGPMWLLRVVNENQVYFMPIPWHNWL